ncbi:ATPase [Candidatus Woesearchaeota archaeon CG10_big_fil_rev_8_21_14_0_10_32_9]|nr:MAG: ATPase [Candidatus Woesearchaeota archaeon CG10_big_fil_rev_8_21_14_0_10_32_9]
MKLKVSESIQDDVNRGIVRIDGGYMKQIGVREGHFVEIKGQKTTVGIVDRALPGDIGLPIIRMDGLLRRNSRSGIGEVVSVKKAEVQEAKKITLAPTREGGIISTNNTEIFKMSLMGRPLMNGDIISMGGTPRRVSPAGDWKTDVLNSLRFGLGDIKLVVLETNPKQGPVVITENTHIEYKQEVVEPKEEETTLEVSYEDVGGLEDEIKKIREMVELPLKHPEIFQKLGIEPPKGVLLHGPPGTGKTLLAKAVANETNSNFYVINGPEIMSKFYGESEANLRKIFDEAEKNSPSIIFFDELDAIASKREESKGEVERRVVAQLLALMDGLKSRGKVVVIAATNIPNSLDPALRRPGRFDRELIIGVPQMEGRLTILKIHTRNMPLAKDVNLNNIAEVTHGFVGADLSSLAKEAAMNVLRKVLPNLNLEEEVISEERLDNLKIKMDDFKEALKVVRPSALREVFIETPNTTWKDVGGLEDVKQELIEAVEWPLKHKDAFKKLGVKPPKGVLLYGPPGTGKTLLAKAVAKESGANFISVKGSDLLSKWINETPQMVKKVFDKARQSAPSIIFIDEIDSVAPNRKVSDSDGRASASGMNAVNQILTEMDGMQELNEIVIIGATNRPDILDTALLRPGRFDRIVLVGSPDKTAREEIFKVHTKGMPLSADVDLKKLVDKTEGYVGADIESVCREAAMLTLRKDLKAEKISLEFFEEALKKVRPSVTKDIEQAYENLQAQFRSAAGNRLKDEKPSYYG